jgi:hypothetical protein
MTSLARTGLIVGGVGVVLVCGMFAVLYSRGYGIDFYVEFWRAYWWIILGFVLLAMVGGFLKARGARATRRSDRGS